MSDIVTAVVRVVLNSGTGTQNITTTDFGGGTPTAAMFFCSTSVTDGTAAPDFVLSVGAATAPDDEWVLGEFDEDGVGTTNTVRHQDHASCVLIPAGLGAVDVECSLNAFITNGVTINVDNAGTQALLTVLLFGGTDLDEHADNVDMGTIVDTEVVVTAPGFRPDTVFGVNHGISSLAATGAHGSFGCVVDDSGIVQRTIGWKFRHGRTTTGNSGRLASDRITFIPLNGGAEDDGIDVDSFEDNGFDVFPRTNGAGNADLAYLALGFGGLKTKLITLDTPTSDGELANTDINFKPQLLIFGMSQIETIDTSTVDDHAGSWGVSIITPDAQFSTSAQSEDAVVLGTTNTQSIADNIAVNLPADDGGEGITATLVSMDALGFTLDWNVPASTTTRRFWCWALEEVAPILEFQPFFNRRTPTYLRM